MSHAAAARGAHAAGRTSARRYYTLGLSTHGGLAERVSAPASTLVEIPEGCAAVEAALAQPLAVGLHGVERAGVEPGQHVVVLGAGAIGSFILAGLSGHDGPVAVVDVDPARLAVARVLGATETHLVERDSTLEELQDRIPDPVDVVVESSGAPGAAARAMGLAARGGRVLLVGLVKAPQELRLADVVLREIDVRTTVAHVCGTDLPRALDLLARRPLSSTIGVRVVALESVVDDGFEPLIAGTGRWQGARRPTPRLMRGTIRSLLLDTADPAFGNTAAPCPDWLPCVARPSIRCPSHGP